MPSFSERIAKLTSEIGELAARTGANLPPGGSWKQFAQGTGEQLGTAASEARRLDGPIAKAAKHLRQYAQTPGQKVRPSFIRDQLVVIDKHVQDAVKLLNSAESRWKTIKDDLPKL